MNVSPRKTPKIFNLALLRLRPLNVHKGRFMTASMTRSPFAPPTLPSRIRGRPVPPRYRQQVPPLFTTRETM